MRISIKRILAGMLFISNFQSYGDFGFMGNTVLRTPQLDKLAASAAIFENYSTGVCGVAARFTFSHGEFRWGVI